MCCDQIHVTGAALPNWIFILWKHGVTETFLLHAFNLFWQQCIFFPVYWCDICKSCFFMSYDNCVSPICLHVLFPPAALGTLEFELRYEQSTSELHCTVLRAKVSMICWKDILLYVIMMFSLFSWNQIEKTISSRQYILWPKVCGHQNIQFILKHFFSSEIFLLCWNIMLLFLFLRVEFLQCKW